MGYSDIFLNSDFFKQIQTMQKVVDTLNSSAIQEVSYIANSPMIQQAYHFANIANSMAAPILAMVNQLPELSAFVDSRIKDLLSDNELKRYNSMLLITEYMQSLRVFNEYEHLATSIRHLDGILGNYDLMSLYTDDMSDKDAAENDKVNDKIATQIYSTEETVGGNIHNEDFAVIALSPINDVVLKYLSQNPEEIYRLTSREFEKVMAEIYNKLGYKVKLTKATRDGGKDIIIRKPDILGDYIYYVECKKYAVDKPVGVGIVRMLGGVINMDKVNGGIIATTSYFAQDAKDLIMDKNLGFQIKLHDYEKIHSLLNRVV